MKVSLDAIKELRNLTAAPVGDCRKALTDAEGDLKKAQELLRKRGLEIAASRGDKVANQGRVEAYVHHGSKIGVLVEVDCETDFVAKNSDFAQFTRDLAMQITACDPAYIKKEDVPKEALEHEKSQEEFYKTHCLLEQAFVKDPGISVNDYLASIVAKMGEKIVIRRFTRYKIGE